MARSLLRQVLHGLAAALPEAPDALTLSEALWLAPLLPSPVDEEFQLPGGEPEEHLELTPGDFEPMDGLPQLDASDSQPGETDLDPLPATTTTSTVAAPESPSHSDKAPAPAAALLPAAALPLKISAARVGM